MRERTWRIVIICKDTYETEQEVLDTFIDDFEHKSLISAKAVEVNSDLPRRSIH